MGNVALWDQGVRSRFGSSAVFVGVVLALLVSSCSGSTSDEGGGAAGTTVDDLSSEAVADGADTESGEPGDVETVAGPTLDGSASLGDVTDVWRLVDDNDFVPDADRSLFNDMESDGNGTLLIAGTTTNHADRSFRATVWRSDDGGDTLSRTVLPTLAEGVKSGIADVEFVPAESPAAADQRIAAVLAGNVGSGSGQRAAIWILRDGEWSQLESDAFLAERREWTNRLSVGESGELLVLGSTTDESGDVQPVAWMSSDGLTWNRLPERFDALDDTTTLVDAAIGDAGMVVIGRFIADAVDHSQVFVSTDGRSWAQSVPSTFVGDGDVLVSSVVPGPDGGFVAVGSVESGDGVYRPASWTSEDGESWNGPSTSFGLNDDGRSASNGLGAERVRYAGGRFLAFSTNAFLQHVWESTDGLIWNPVGNIWDAAADGVDLSGIAVADEEPVAVGEGRVYRFANGRWSRLRSDEAVPQPTTVSWANGVAANGDGFLIAGGYQDSRNEQFGRAWSSPDGLDWAEVEIPAVVVGRLDTGPYRDVAATDVGFLAAAPETTSISSSKGRFGVSYLHAFGPDGAGLPTVHGDDAARVVLTSVATLGDEVVMAGITFDGDVLRPVMVAGTMNDEVFEPFGPSTLDGDGPVRLTEESVPTPNEADREAWAALCSSPDTMVAVLGLDDSSSGSVRFFSRSIDDGWQQAVAGPEVVAPEEHNWVNACLHGGDGFLAVGGVRTGSDSDGALWRSLDGSEWEKLDVPTEMTDPAANGWLIDVAVAGDDYLIVGTADVDGATVATGWLGSPATGWQAFPVANNPVDFSVSSIAVKDDGTVVIAGWQDGQMTVIQTTVDALRATS